MSKQQSSSKRRQLLKSIVAGSGTIAAGKSLPESWSKPVINAIVLPAHAALTDDTGLLGAGATTSTTAAPACCEGVFCNLTFNDGGPIGGSAQISSDCTITVEGGSIGGSWSGSGIVAADGSFSFDVTFNGGIFPPNTTTTLPPSVQKRMSGTVTADCSSISGTLESWGAFSATKTPGATDLNFCD